MELLNPAFVILCVKIAFCVLPAVLGLFLLNLSEERNREMRNACCNRIFGVSNAIPSDKFKRVLTVVGVLSLLFSAAAAWVLLFAGMFSDK